MYSFKTAFGGGQSTGFGLIYDDLESRKKVRFAVRECELSHR